VSEEEAKALASLSITVESYNKSFEQPADVFTDTNTKTQYTYMCSCCADVETPAAKKPLSTSSSSGETPSIGAVSYWLMYIILTLFSSLTYLRAAHTAVAGGLKQMKLNSSTPKRSPKKTDNSSATKKRKGTPKGPSGSPAKMLRFTPL
jgi:hypothetical protein